MAGSAWSTEEQDALRKLSEKNYTLAEIVASGIFNRTPNAILSQATALKLSLAGIKKEIDRDAFKRMMEARNGSDRV